jgi:hypothetical protein
MAEVKITSVDLEGSKPNIKPHQSKIVFNLSEAPTIQWTKDFEIARAKSAKLDSMGIQQLAINGAQIEVHCVAGLKAQVLLDELKVAVNATNSGESDFHQQLADLKF